MGIGAPQQEKAVEIGYWPLFRFDPTKPKGKKFKLDSKEPLAPVSEFIPKNNCILVQ